MSILIRTLVIFFLAFPFLFSCSPGFPAAPVAPIPADAAVFEVISVSATPASVAQGESVSVELEIANTGKAAGTYSAELKINGMSRSSQVVQLDPRSRKKITFAVSEANAGDYSATVGSASAKFTVTAKLMTNSVTWAEVDFDIYAHQMTGTNETLAYPYSIQFKGDNKFGVISAMNFNFPLAVKNGKICFGNVPQIAWQDIFSKARAYFNYDVNSGDMIWTGVPDKMAPKIFGPDMASMPVIESVSISPGSMTVKYFVPSKPK
jgi:hypothetical protein